MKYGLKQVAFEIQNKNFCLCCLDLHILADFYWQTLLYLIDFSTSKSVINLSRHNFEIFPVYEKRELSQGLAMIRSTKPN